MKISNQIVNFAAFVSLLSISTAGAQTDVDKSSDSLRVDEVIRQVLQNNDRLAAARYMEKSAFAKAKSAGAWDDPMLMLGVTNLPTTFDFREDAMTMKMVGLSWNLPYTGRQGLESRAARTEAQAARDQTSVTALDLVTSARLAYYDLYYRGRILQDIQSQRDLFSDIVASTLAKLRADQATQADVSAAQADQWRLEADILTAQQDIEATQNQLFSLMGREPLTSFPLLAAPIMPVVPATVEPWLNAARDNYPALRRLKNQSAGYAYSARAANRMRFPMIGLEGSYGFRADAKMPEEMGGTTTTDRDNMISFQANISLPIFSGRKQGRMAESMRAMSQSSQAEADQLWRDVSANLRSLHAQAARLAQSLKLYRERVIPADEDAFRSAYAGYAANRVQFIYIINYAVAVYRDKITASQIEFELARTLAQAGQYITDTNEWNLNKQQ